jgi:methylated-DNA-protein-cysteine methyltransferase-like protein
MMQVTRTRHQTLQAIWRAVRAIPRGQVSTYGSIARHAGLPGRARLVGHALKVAPDDLDLPWHRVVAAGGRIAFPKSSRQFAEQRRRLCGEGVELVRSRVVRLSKDACGAFDRGPKGATFGPLVRLSKVACGAFDRVTKGATFVPLVRDAVPSLDELLWKRP